MERIKMTNTTAVLGDALVTDGELTSGRKFSGKKGRATRKATFREERTGYQKGKEKGYGKGVGTCKGKRSRKRREVGSGLAR